MTFMFNIFMDPLMEMVGICFAICPPVSLPRTALQGTPLQWSPLQGTPLQWTPKCKKKERETKKDFL